MAQQRPKYEREILEILERVDHAAPLPPRQPSPLPPLPPLPPTLRLWAVLHRWGRAVGAWATATSGAGWRWIGVTIGCGVLGLLLRPLAPPLAALCAVLMVLAFLSPLLTGWRRDGPAEEYTPTWRGRPQPPARRRRDD